MNYRKAIRKIKRFTKKIFIYINYRRSVFFERFKKKEYKKQDEYLGKNIYLHYWKISTVYSQYTLETENLGDYLSRIVVNHFLPVFTEKHKKKKEKTLYAVGSIIGLRRQDAVIWGSGILSPTQSRIMRIKKSKLDIRAVRGPKTRQELLKAGKKCPKIYGDPAILLPYVFTPKKTYKKYKYTLIFNYDFADFKIPDIPELHILNILTKDYENFITDIVQSELIISSSLHGIILAETYGVKAILLSNERMDMFKYKDWYYSTNRKTITVAHSIEEAINIRAMALPDLSNMQKQLIKVFPKDLWD